MLGGIVSATRRWGTEKDNLVLADGCVYRTVVVVLPK